MHIGQKVQLMKVIKAHMAQSYDSSTLFNYLSGRRSTRGKLIVLYGEPEYLVSALMLNRLLNVRVFDLHVLGATVKGRVTCLQLIKEDSIFTWSGHGEINGPDVSPDDITIIETVKRSVAQLKRVK